MSGETFVSRMAGSLLHAVGMPELIAPPLAEYEALARRLAQHPEFFAAIRAKLQRNKSLSAVFDAARFCRHLEVAYETMWRRHRRGEPPPALRSSLSAQRSWCSIGFAELQRAWKRPIASKAGQFAG